MATGSVKPGPKKPTKYPKTGPNYAKWGELEYAGYGYNPETDTYFFDPMIQERYNAEAQKQLKDEYEKKPPSIWEQGAAAALPAAIGSGTKYLLSGDGRDWLSGLLGIGSGGGHDWIKEGASSLGNGGLLNLGSGLIDTVGDYGGDFLDAVSDYGGDAIDWIGDVGGDVIDWIGGLF